MKKKNDEKQMLFDREIEDLCDLIKDFTKELLINNINQMTNFWKQQGKKERDVQLGLILTTYISLIKYLINSCLVNLEETASFHIFKNSSKIFLYYLQKDIKELLIRLENEKEENEKE